MQMNNEIFLLNCRDLADENLFEKACQKVSEDRRTSLESLRFIEDKRLSLGVGVLIEYARSLYPFLPEVIHDEEGKPHFDGDPYYISISHAHEYAMIGISEKPVGVDVEYFHHDHESIMRHFFRDDEKAFIDQSTDRRKAFFELWSRKEAYIKRNEPTDIRKFSVIDPQPGMQYLSFPLEENYSCVAYVSSEQETRWHCANGQYYLDFL